MKLKAAIIVFLGTNCDRDTKMALEECGFIAEFVFHTCTNLEGYDLVLLPGGFSFGDYIRAGRLAKLSPVTGAVKEYVKSGMGFVLGICNGFQILCEAGLLPGALVENANTRFISEDEPLVFNGRDIVLPIAHKEGRYWACDADLDMIKKNNMNIITYKTNPNGSLGDIAGLYDSKHKIFGLMPHPERAVLKHCGLSDGKKVFDFIKNEIIKIRKTPDVISGGAYDRS